MMLCPVGGGTCVTVICPTTSCPASGLTPETSYVVQASWSAGPLRLACPTFVLLLLLLLTIAEWPWCCTAGSRQCPNRAHALHPLATLQAVAVKANGDQSPPSNKDFITMPSLPGPILTSAKPWGPTTGQAVATAPAGVAFSQASGSSHA